MGLTVDQLVMSIGGTLVAVVAVLWKLYISSVNHKQEKLEKCEELHLQNQKTITELTGEMNYLKGQMDGVKSLSRAVLDKVEEISNAKDS